MSPEELLQVGGTTNSAKHRSNINAIDLDITEDLDIKAVNTHSSREPSCQRKFSKESFRQKDNRNSDDLVGSKDDARPPTKYCSACGTYGHTTDGCPAAGKILHITEWLKRLTTDERRDFLREYKKNRVDTHRRYMEGKKSRKNLKMQINAISLQNANDQNLDALICCAITDTKKTATSIDFGLLDNNFIDMSELELNNDIEEWPEYEKLAEMFE